MTDRFAARPTVIGGRYGLSSKEFTPAMVKAIFDELGRATAAQSLHHRHRRRRHAHEPRSTTGRSAARTRDAVRAVFYGLGADGTVGANKNSIKIIGEETPLFAQGYFVYDSKKAGAMTVSHLRFGPRPIQSTYLISEADFVACHQFALLERVDVLGLARPGAVFLLNSPYGPEEVWDRSATHVQETIIAKRIDCHVIDADSCGRRVPAWAAGLTRSCRHASSR